MANDENKNMNKNRQTGEHDRGKTGQSQEQMKCKSCGTSFTSQDELRRHEQSQHSQEKRPTH